MTTREVEEWREYNRQMIGYDDMNDDEKTEFDEEFDKMLNDYLKKHNDSITDEKRENIEANSADKDHFEGDEDIRAKLSQEINEEIDGQKERKASRQEFQDKYNEKAVTELKNTDPEQYQLKKETNKLAVHEELDEAQGGETCWDSMSGKEKMEMQKTNPDRARALLQDYQDRHPGGHDIDEQTDDEKRMARERQVEHREQREANISDEVRESRNPYKEILDHDIPSHRA